MRSTIKKLLTAVLFILLCLLCLCASASAQTNTVMLYMCGTDIEEDALVDLKEICAANNGTDVKVVILAGGTKDWSDNRLTDKTLNLFTISNGSWSSITNWGKGSMGSVDTLKKFVTYCWKNYRSDRNILIMWDHGSSAAYGLCFDEVYNDDALVISELGSAFSSLSSSLPGFHLDIIGADACLMGCYEMAATLAPYADVYVASEELEPYLGWYYTNWLTTLGQNPNMSNRDLAIAIVDSYIYGCNRDDPNDYLTLSAIDLQYMTELTTCINSLANTLSAQLSSSLSTISRTLQSTYVFGNYDDAGSDMIDISDFLDLCANYDSQTTTLARQILKNAIIKNYANSYVPSATGMSIFVPMENSKYLSSFLSDYSSPAISGYCTFVTTFAKSVSGTSWNFSSSTAPTQLGSNDTVWSAFDYFLSNANNLWGYGTGFGYNTSDLIIAGLNGTTTSGSSAGVSTSTVVIAGLTDLQTPAPIEISSESDSDNTIVTPPVTIAANAFSMTLSDEDMHYLSYAELLLYQDFSDDTEIDLDELGRVQSTWIDWENNTVYAVFDNTWPAIDDVLVVMYEQSRTDYGRRCIIPVMLNGTTRTYLVIEYRANETEGTILGTSQGWSSDGLMPVRGITELQNDDTITPIYPSFYTNDLSSTTTDAMQTSWTVYDDDGDFVITWDGTQTIWQADLPEGDYKLAFRLHDIFGGITTSDFISFTVE